MNICCLQHLLMYPKAYYHWARMIRQMTSAREWNTAVERRLYCWPDALTLKKTLSSSCSWLCCMLWFVCVVTRCRQTTAMICAKSFLIPSSVQTSTTTLDNHAANFPGSPASVCTKRDPLHRREGYELPHQTPAGVVLTEARTLAGWQSTPRMLPHTYWYH